MKKQKKLNLGKIKIAGINNTHSIIGGVETIVGLHTCSNCDTYGPECVTVRYCDTELDTICATTTQTRAQSDACTNRCPLISENGEIC